LQNQPETNGKKVGVVGYCMSGGMALRTAAHFPDKVAAAASIHGSFLGADDPNSPHHSVGKAKAEIHIGLAEEDFVMPDDQIARLRAALEASDLKYELETYPGTHHGFTIVGAPIYDHAQAERHWEKMLSLFDRNLEQT
jgi:carboxymethylenebutenolidase